MVDDIEIRALRDGDDLDEQLDLTERAFGPKSADSLESWRQRMRLVIASGSSRGAFDGSGRCVGSALFYDMRQWWHGRPVPMAGVSAVKVAPEARGYGIGGRLMSGLLDEMAAGGFPLAVLYPATIPFYRSLGWEQAGARYTAEIPARALSRLAPPDLPSAGSPPAVRRATPGDAGVIGDVIARVHERARDCGAITWDRAVTALTAGDKGMYMYLCDDGFTWYRWQDGNDTIFAGGVQAATAGAARALWSVIASNGTIAETIRFLTHPGDPIWQLTVERDTGICSTWNWMLRVVDAPAAIAARGFPQPVSIDLPLIIIDQHRPANAGGWLLSVAGGKGELTRRDTEGALQLGARGLAALYAGTPVSSLRIAGLAAGGDPAADAALDAAFRASPYLLDVF